MKKTDRDRLIELLTDFGVEADLIDSDNLFDEVVVRHHGSGTMTSFSFLKDGTFSEVTAGEE